MDGKSVIALRLHQNEKCSCRQTLLEPLLDLLDDLQDMFDIGLVGCIEIARLETTELRHAHPHIL